MIESNSPEEALESAEPGRESSGREGIGGESARNEGKVGEGRASQGGGPSPGRPWSLPHTSPYVHLDLLPDTGTAPPASLDFEPVTGRPAWFHAQREARGSEEEVNPSSRRRSASLEIREAGGERGASRWFALKRMFHEEAEPEELPTPRAAEARIPSLAVFSLAGGVGKTSLVATLGRALSGHGERVLLVDTTSLGLLPFYFGARELRPGVVRTFAAPGSTDAAINMVGVDPNETGPHEGLQGEERTPQDLGQQGGPSDWMVDEISRHARGASRILIDLATASSSVTSRLLKLAPTMLVPVTPDMNSVVSLNTIESFFRSQGIHQGTSHGSFGGSVIQPYYVINQFDPSLALHLDVREVMRQQLGDRLLPFTVRRNPVVSEAMAQGMTVMDYAPNSPVAEDYMTLAGWIRSVSAPATPGYRGVRWSERSV